MPHRNQYCISVQFTCTCKIRTCIVVEECHRAKSPCFDEGHSYYCYPTKVEAANQTNKCAKCWVQLKPDSKDPFSQAMEKEAKKICDAYLEAFKALGNWGYKVKGPGSNIRVTGTIYWVKRLQGIEMDSQGLLPQPELGLQGNIKVPGCFEYGGHKIFKSTPAPHEGDVSGYCMESIMEKKDDIMAVTNAARKALEEKGFMVHGQFLQILSTFDTKSSEESSDFDRRTIHKWSFLKWDHACAFIIIYRLNDGDSVEIARIEEKACQQGPNDCRYLPLENSTKDQAFTAN